MLRIIPPAVHFIQDSVITAFLILGPFFFSLSETAKLLSLAGGIQLLIYNGITDRPGALFPVISEKIHAVLDYGGVAALLVLPWIIFTGMDRWYFFGLGIVTFALAVLVDFTPDSRGGTFAARLPRWLGTTTLAFAATFAVLYVVFALV